jgi:4-diphosphocytidyl-2-C-methyl-D-erythritol kinase
MRSVTLRAFAKINLSLRIKEVRSDGYHEVQTILQAIDLADRLKIAARRGPFEIRCDVSRVPLDRTNLVWKAAQLLWQTMGWAGEPRGAIVTLQKRIPMQAGLGGGSSDAAAALVGLRRVWKLRVPDDRMFAMAAQLGSDVPYFLVGGTALGLGRGEEVYALADLPRLWVVLAFAPFGVATREAYAWLDEDRNRGRVHSSADTNAAAEECTRPLFPHLTLANDFEASVIDRHPLIGTLKRRLAQNGALMTAMTGSGSTVFGVFKSGSAARSAARMLKKAGAQVATARFLPRPTGPNLPVAR